MSGIFNSDEKWREMSGSCTAGGELPEFARGLAAPRACAGATAVAGCRAAAAARGFVASVALLLIAPLLTPPLAAQQAATADEKAPPAVVLADDIAAARAWIGQPAADELIAGYGPALETRYLRYDSPRPLRLWIAKLDLTDPNLKIVATEPADFTTDDDPENDKFETRCETTLEFAQRTGAQLAINTSAFGPFRPRAGGPMEIAGLAAHEGKIYSPPARDYGAIYISDRNRVALKGPPLPQDDLWTVVPGFRMLLDDGEYVVNPRVARSGHGQLNPRTAIGVDKAGETIWLVVADGRQKDVSMGVTLVELAALFEWLGCWDALNLDGGGSSTFVMQTPLQNHQVINTPVGRGEPESLRQVGHNLGFRLAGRGPDLPRMTAFLPDSPSILAEFDDRPLFSLNEAELGRYLGALQERMPSVTERIIHLARKNLGQPYDIYLLGEYPFETYDPDPLYCLTKSDCLTHAEHMYAMALSGDFWQFLRTLQRLRYKDGEIGMVTRNHYTIADWNRNNGFLFEDVTAQLADGTAHKPLKQVCKRAPFLKQFGLGQDIPDEPITDVYIPKDNVHRVLADLRDGDFVNIIRGSVGNEYCGHTGLIAHAPDGTVDFLHSARPKVQEAPLLSYIHSDRRCLGIKILRLRPDAERIMREMLSASPKMTPVDEAALQAATAQNLPPVSALQPEDQRVLHAQRVQALKLDGTEPDDPPLRWKLAAADKAAREALDMKPAERAFGVVDLTDLRFAWLEPDQLFYGASVPKIAILLGYFEQDPQRLAELTPEVQSELELMIKRSSNEMAAKYSQLVGLEFLQQMVTGERYRFYDAKRGGGLWCGKHYGLEEPRTGDPVADHSHAVTVRQMLRYYLMLEQNRLVNPQVSAKMREIFSAPSLAFHRENFVGGLTGRGVSLIRKSGLWENWHLDTARVQHNERVYLLAGATQHAKGQEYLARMAAAVDEMLCGEPGPMRPRHELRMFDDFADWQTGMIDNGTIDASGHSLVFEGRGEYVSPVLTPTQTFNEVLLSWNIVAPPGTAAFVWLRTADDDGRWTGDTADAAEWLPLGRAGGLLTAASHPTSRPAESVGNGFGVIDVDYFRSDIPLRQLQFKVRIHRDDENAPPVKIRRIAVTTTDSIGVPTATFAPTKPAPTRPRGAAQQPLPVPFFSQRTEKPEIAGRICSPTSLAMVMAYRGVERPVGEVAAAAFDATHDIYGNWPLNVQAAFQFGVPGYLTRLSAWDEVTALLDAGQPLIISIRFHEEGLLRNAPYKSTKGHLLVVTGLAPDGMVHVNDPAATSAEAGQLRYHREDLEKVWLQATGGVTYVLLPPEERSR